MRFPMLALALGFMLAGSASARPHHPKLYGYKTKTVTKTTTRTATAAHTAQSLLPECVAANAAQKVVTIQVGGTPDGPRGVTTFTPSLVVADVGSIVRFQFAGHPGNHTVTQSSLDAPCQPLDGGFDSGWIFVDEELSSPPEWNITITDDRIPIIFYCKQLGKGAPHCNAGMVGAINIQNSNKSLDTVVSLAKSETDVTPGQSQNGFTGIGALATAVPFLPPDSGVQYINAKVGATIANVAAPPQTSMMTAEETPSAADSDSQAITTFPPDSDFNSGALSATLTTVELSNSDFTSPTQPALGVNAPVDTGGAARGRVGLPMGMGAVLLFVSIFRATV